MYHFTINFGKMRGILVYKDRAYMVDGPKQFRELSPYHQEVNAICRTNSYSKAKKIRDALNLAECPQPEPATERGAEEAA